MPYEEQYRTRSPRENHGSCSKTTTAFRHITEGSYAFVKFFNQSSCCFRQTLFVCNKVKYVRKILLSGYGNFNAEKSFTCSFFEFQAKPLPLREPVLPQCHENFFPSESQTLLCSSAKHLNVSGIFRTNGRAFSSTTRFKKYGWHPTWLSLWIQELHSPRVLTVH